MLVLTLGGLVENCNLYHEFPLLTQLLSDQIKNKTKQKKKKPQMESGSLCHNDEQYTKHMYSNYYKTCICSASQNIGTLLILAS